MSTRASEIASLGFLAALVLAFWLGSEYMTPSPQPLPYRVLAIGMLLGLVSVISRRIK